MNKFISFLTVASIVVLLSVQAFAHPGGTDMYGGHYDNNTGEYHYHHGYPAHQHPDGICPYEPTSEEQTTAFWESPDFQNGDEYDNYIYFNSYNEPNITKQTTTRAMTEKIEENKEPISTFKIIVIIILSFVGFIFGFPILCFALGKFAEYIIELFYFIIDKFKGNKSK